MLAKKFQIKKEDFACLNCGLKVRGSGRTNHCPRCLWSRHVDVNPGDRRSLCQSLMAPVGMELKQGEYVILHRCLACGLKKKNKTAKNDDFNAILKLSASASFKS